MKQLVFSFLGCVMSLWLFSQEKKDTLYIQPGHYMLEEMVVSGSKWEQDPSEIAAKISVIRLSEIQLSNPQNAADLIGISNGVFIQKSQLGGGSPMIRGFGTNRVLLVIDGVRLNNAIFRSGNVQNVISLDANAIREAEVIFGPGAVIYGSDAIGGVMDFHTLRPTVAEAGKQILAAHGLARYSSANAEQTFHGDISGSFGKWALLSSFSRSSFGDLRIGSKGPMEYTRPDFAARENNVDVQLVNPRKNVQSPSGYDQNNLMQKILFAVVPGTEVTYAFHYSATSSYARYDRLLLQKDNGQLANAEWYYGPQKWQMHNITADFKNSTRIYDGMKMVVAYQQFSESRHNRPFGALVRQNRFEKVNAISFNADAEKKMSDRIHVFYGAEVVLNDVDSKANGLDIISGNVFPISTRYPDGAVWRTYAAYVSMRRKIKHWTLSSSLRYSRFFVAANFDKSFFPFPFDQTKLNRGTINGSAGVTYNSRGGVKWYGNLSTGFRAPNVDDIGKVFDSSPGMVIIPNAELKPEYAYNLETGITTPPGKKLQADFTVYYTFLDHAIQRGNSYLGGNQYIEYDGELSRVQSLQNISEIVIYGLQAGLTYKLPYGLRFSSTANVQKGRELLPETNEYLTPSHVAPVFGSAHLRYRTKKWQSELYTIYNAKVSFDKMPLTERADAFLYKKDEEGNPYVPSWVTMNFKGTVTINRFATLDLGVENIFDKRYRPFASGISAPGRNFIIAMRFRLNDMQ